MQRFAVRLDEKRVGSVGLECRYKPDYIKKLSSTLTPDLLGSQRAVDIAKQLLKVIGPMVLWCKSDTGEPTGVSTFLEVKYPPNAKEAKIVLMTDVVITIKEINMSDELLSKKWEQFSFNRSSFQKEQVAGTHVPSERRFPLLLASIGEENPILLAAGSSGSPGTEFPSLGALAKEVERRYAQPASKSVESRGMVILLGGVIVLLILAPVLVIRIRGKA